MKIGFHAFASSGLVGAIEAATRHTFDWTTIFTVDGQTFSLSSEKPVRTQLYTICIQVCRGGEEQGEVFCYDCYGSSGIVTRIIEAGHCFSAATLMGHPLTTGLTHADDSRYYITIETDAEGSF